ncbi:hypothetical protein M0802_007616 [Mischocyttarus mexicanus]|nr:hypothetical protein M0802_007616 [Mischocyttarus mexicanus]
MILLMLPVGRTNAVLLPLGRHGAWRNRQKHKADESGKRSKCLRTRFLTENNGRGRGEKEGWGWNKVRYTGSKFVEQTVIGYRLNSKQIICFRRAIKQEELGAQSG